jgi:hypothetical protein
MTAQTQALLPTIVVDELTKNIMAKRLVNEANSTVAVSLLLPPHPGGLDHTKNSQSVEKVVWTTALRDQAIAITRPKDIY